MLRMTLLLLLNISLCITSWAQAGTISKSQPHVLRTVQRFNDIEPTLIFLVKKYGAKNIVLVSDVDDTLITMPSFIGSDAWWDWQFELLHNDPTSPDLVATTFNGLMRAQHWLNTLQKMQLTDQQIPTTIASFEKQGGVFMIETGRGVENSDVTEHQLSNVGLKKDLAMNDTLTKLMQCDGLKRDILYRDGAMYVAGQNKGLALQCFLKQTKRHYKAIVFIDDVLKNDTDIIHAFDRQQTDIAVYAFQDKHNSKKHHNGVNNKAIHVRATKQWQQLKKMTDSVFNKKTDL